MKSIIEIGQELIQRGSELNNSDLIELGHKLLVKHQTDQPPEDEMVIPYSASSPEYHCSNCGHYFPVDKNNRVKCPQCKKHTLVVQQVAIEEVPKSHHTVADSFTTQIRKPTNSRIRYNDQGEVEGTYSRTEQIEGVTNVWTDDKTEGFDQANEALKKITKISPRTRQPVKFMSVVCESCKEKYSVHPFHAGARGRYLCDRCIRKRGRT